MAGRLRAAVLASRMKQARVMLACFCFKTHIGAFQRLHQGCKPPTPADVF